jgi:hypothetical protein
VVQVLLNAYSITSLKLHNSALKKSIAKENVFIVIKDLVHFTSRFGPRLRGYWDRRPYAVWHHSVLLVVTEVSGKYIDLIFCQKDGSTVPLTT